MKNALPSILSQREIQFYLPLYRSARKWSDGSRVTLDLPLFPGYLFIHIQRSERSRVRVSRAHWRWWEEQVASLPGCPTPRLMRCAQGWNAAGAAASSSDSRPARAHPLRRIQVSKALW